MEEDVKGSLSIKDRIQFSCGKLYKVGANSVRYSGNEIYEIGGIRIK